MASIYALEGFNICFAKADSTVAEAPGACTIPEESFNYHVETVDNWDRELSMMDRLNGFDISCCVSVPDENGSKKISFKRRLGLQ